MIKKKKIVPITLHILPCICGRLDMNIFICGHTIEKVDLTDEEKQNVISSSMLMIRMILP